MKEMTSRERVLTVFEHQEPDRVPMWCGASADFWNKAKRQLNLDDESLRVRFHDDFRGVLANFNIPNWKPKPGIAYTTLFGVDRSGIGYGHPTSHPLAEASLKQIHDYAWPDPEWVDPSNVRNDASKHDKKYAILGGIWSPFWHDAIDLLGMENMFIKMYSQPEIVDAVLQHIVDYYANSSQKVFDAAADSIDIFFIGNDFGSQTGPLIGANLFKRFIQPHLKRFVDLGHSYKLKVMMHSCGGIVPLIPLMIEAGLDSLHAVQTTCYGMDLKELKSQFGNKIVFNGCID